MLHVSQNIKVKIVVEIAYIHTNFSKLILYSCIFEPNILSVQKNITRIQSITRNTVELNHTEGTGKIRVRRAYEMGITHTSKYICFFIFWFMFRHSFIAGIRDIAEIYQRILAGITRSLNIKALTISIVIKKGVRR